MCVGCDGNMTDADLGMGVRKGPDAGSPALNEPPLQ